MDISINKANMISKGKNTLAAALIAVMALVATACTATGAQAAIANPGEVYTAISAGIEMPGMMELPEGIILDFYGIKSEDYTDGVFYICEDSLLADEVVIVNATDAEAAKRVQEKLEARLNQQLISSQGYSPVQNAIISKCKVRVDGLTVALLISPDIDEMTRIYESFIKK